MRDIDVRQKIKQSYLKKYFNDPSSRVVDELSVSLGFARVDIAVINGALHGYEIKSSSDTLYRLQHQIETYAKTFDYLTIVCGEKHLPGVLSTVPSWCGVIVATEKKSTQGLKLKKLRDPKKNFDIDKYAIAQLLWKPEAIECLNSVGITAGINSKPKSLLWKMLSEALSTKDLCMVVRERLKVRANWRFELLPSESDGYFQLSSKL